MSVKNIGKGRWRVNVKTGIDPETGKPTYFDTTIKGTHEDAKRLEAEHVLFDKGALSKLALKDYAEVSWLPCIKQELAGNTYDYYLVNLRKHVIPALGSMKMCDIDVGTVRRFLVSLPESGKVGARKTLSAVLSFAAEEGVIQLNPVKLISSRAKKSKNKGRRRKAYRVYSDEERQTFYRAVYGTCIEGACLVMLDGGARPEEACGLDWELFDWDDCTAEVKQAYTTRLKSGKCEMKDPKNEESYRDLIFAGYAADRLYGLSIGQTGPICKNPDGSRMGPKDLNSLFVALHKLHGLPKEMTAKHLRHTFATQHVKDGTPISEIRDLLGHSSTSTVTDMYVIPLREDLVRAQKDMAAKHDPRRKGIAVA